MKKSGTNPVYFELTYETDYHQPAYFRSIIKHHPVAVEMKKSGYDLPDLVGSHNGNIKQELSALTGTIVALNVQKNRFPNQYFKAVDQMNALELIQKLYSENKIIKE